MTFIPYGRQYLDSEDIKAVVKTLKSDWLTQGPMIKTFEDALCTYTSAKYAVVVSNGTAALHIACLAAGISSGDEIITSPLTFVASANCALYCGAGVRFCDIVPDTANINPIEISNVITKKTKAVIPVHYAGHPCAMEEIYNIAKERDLTVIEDAAHALGAHYKSGKHEFKIGSCSHSNMTIFSFHPVKHITTGEGGAVLTNSKKLYDLLLLFRSHGITKDQSKFKNKTEKNNGWYYEMQYLGYNYRMTDIQAALGVSQLRKIDRFVKTRRSIAEIYNKMFYGNPYFDIPTEKDYAYSSYHLYSINIKKDFFGKRAMIFKKLRDAGIGVQVHYIPVHLQPYYVQRFGYSKGMFPVAEDFYNGEISLPMYFGLQKKNVEFVAEKVLGFCRECCK